MAELTSQCRKASFVKTLLTECLGKFPLFTVERIPMAENGDKLLETTSKSRIRGQRLNDETKARPDDLDIVEATDRAIREYGFCPNRVWAVARSHNRRERIIPFLFPRDDKNLKQLFMDQGSSKRNDHASCTFDFCEQSEINSTNVAQSHESPSCMLHPCHHVVGHTSRPLFEREALNRAVDEGQSTAWQLHGRKLVLPGQTYMAISHVWSDGTGTGGRRPGEVNKCLYDYFGSVARHFQFDGLWWDTLCIPSEKMARAKALNNMHLNYREAEMTFVHDRFLRELDPPDAETACIAILMCPWFSRGWTALELSHSNKVKIAFKNRIMDLDDDILKKPRTDRHFIATIVINKLRRNDYINLDNLLQVLSSRYTSWARDMTIIAGLLVGLTFDPTSAPVTADTNDVQYQQGIYLDILRRVGRIGYENLYHNLPTVFNGSSWCPAKLLSLPICPPVTSSDTISSSAYGLRVDPGGHIVGGWRVVPLGFWSDDSFTLRDAHPLVAVKLRMGLADQENHRCLAQPFAVIDRVLLAKVANNSGRLFKFVGCLQLRHKLRTVDDIPFKPEKIMILNGELESDTELDLVNWHSKAPSDTIVMDNLAEAAISYEAGLKSEVASTEFRSVGEAERGSPCSFVSHQTANCSLLDRPSQFNTEYKLDEWSKRYRNIQYNPGTPQSFSDVDYKLLNAAKAGDEEQVRDLLRNKGARSTVSDKDGRTALSWAAGMGHPSIVTILCEARRAYIFSEPEGSNHASMHPKRCIVDDMSERAMIFRNKLDKLGRSPLSWAVGEGQVECVRTLLRYSDVDIDAADPDGWSPLWYATNKGIITIMKLLIGAGAPTNRSIDSSNQCLLGRVSCRGSAYLVNLLIDRGDRNDLVYYQAMQSAAETGNASVVQCILDEGVDPDAITPDDCRTPLMYAICNEREEVVRILLNAGTSDVNRGASSTFSDTPSFPSKVALPLWTPLFEAVGAGLPEEFNAAFGNQSPRSAEAIERRISIVKMLLETGKIDVNRKHKVSEKLEQYRGYTRGRAVLHIAAKHGDNAIVELLLGVKAIDVNVQDTGGETALFLAAEAGHASTVNLLLRTNEVDLDLKTSRFEERNMEWLHLTPFEVAKKHKHYDVIECFRQELKRKKQLAKQR